MRPVWRQALVSGSNALCVEGAIATVDYPAGHPAAAFSGPSTAILGASSSEEMFALDRTVATWTIDLNMTSKDVWLKGFLVVACLRHFGGCHTKTKDQRAEIRLDDAPFESFRLANIPPSHDDYFYRPVVPEAPWPQEVATCQTIYAWPLLRERLRLGGSHVVKIILEKFVRWDIDYIGIVYQVHPQTDYDIALSFAGEDRPYVEKVADLLRAKKVKVFYDLYAQVDLWGENLYDHLTELYQERATHTVLFISQHYKDKLWTNLERRAAQARALSEANYILPVRFDQTELPGMLRTTGYVEASRLEPEQLVDLILRKIRWPNSGLPS